MFFKNNTTELPVVEIEPNGSVEYEKKRSVYLYREDFVLFCLRLDETVEIIITMIIYFNVKHYDDSMQRSCNHKN